MVADKLCVYFRLAGKSRKVQVRCVQVASLELGVVQQAVVELLGLTCEPRSLLATDAETGERLVAHVRPRSTVVFKPTAQVANVPIPDEDEEERFARMAHSKSERRRARPGALDCKVPTGYLCKLCREPGHFCRECPNRARARATQRRTPKPATGIPRSTLVAVEAPAAMPADPDLDGYSRPVGGLISDGRGQLLTTVSGNKFEKLMEECRFGGSGRFGGSSQASVVVRCAACQQPCRSGAMTTRCCYSTYCASCSLLDCCLVCRSPTPETFQNKRLDRKL